MTELELLAVIFSVQYYRQYLLGRRFRVRSDHQSLVWLFSLKDLSGKLQGGLKLLRTLILRWNTDLASVRDIVPLCHVVLLQKTARALKLTCLNLKSAGHVISAVAERK